MQKSAQILQYRSLVVLLLLITFNTVYSQETKKYTITSQVVTKGNNNPIPNAHIINLRTGYGVTSNTEGKFEIDAASTDTLRFSVIGYTTERISAMRFLGFLKQQFVVLKPQVYQLDEFNVKAMTWKSFRDSVIALEIPEEDWKEQRWIEKLFTTEQLEELTVLAGQSGITFAIKGKYSKQREEVKKLEKEKIVADIAEERYNPEMVQRLSGLEKDSVRLFMRYMAFDTKEVTKLNDYQLIKNIMSKLIEFRTAKKDTL